jgi:hypothetical protein
MKKGWLPIVGLLSWLRIYLAQLLLQKEEEPFVDQLTIIFNQELSDSLGVP